jgi:class 3 adenylate cyclase
VANRDHPGSRSGEERGDEATFVTVRAQASGSADFPCRLDHVENSMTALPAGAITFLFTDIEGSTRLWERDRPAMARV